MTADLDDLTPATNVGPNPIIEATLFDDVKARTAARRSRPWREIAEQLSSPAERASKSACKLLKLATFGEVRSAKGSLRHDANVLQVFGIEGDYDGAVMTPAEAAQRLTDAGIEALVYTSPSHRPEAPRWRVVCPLSAPCSPQDRAQHVDRLDAALGGILARESWAISQSFYVGRVKGAPYEAHHVRGECIDTLPGQTVQPQQPPRIDASAAEDDGAIFDLLTRAHSDDKFSRLWSGDISGYTSQSEADAALCEKLAFYTGKDAAAIDSAFRASGLMRDKWDREDYRQRTIKRAIEWCRETHRDFKLPRTGKFKFIPVHEFAKRTPPPWIVKRLIPQAEIGVIFGESGAGKSFFTLDLVLAIARGLPEWRGHRVRQGRIAYVCAEGDGDFILRTRAYAHHHQVDLAQVPLSILTEAPNLAGDSDADELIIAIEEAGGADIVVIDTLAATTPGADENGGKDMGPVLARCKAIRKATGAMVLLVAHAGKDATRGMRGWSGIKCALDVEIEVTRSGDDRIATVNKLKGGQEGEEFGFKLLPVVLEIDEDGDEVTSCVADPNQAVPKARRKVRKLGAVEKITMRAVQDLTATGDQADVNEVIEVVAGQMSVEAGRDTRRQRISRALDSLTADGLLVREGTRYALA